MRPIEDLVVTSPTALVARHPVPGAQWQAALARWLDDGAEPGPSKTEQPSQSNSKS